MAELLGTPEKTNWKSCELTKEEEAKMVEDLKAAFGPHDPALE